MGTSEQIDLEHRSFRKGATIFSEGDDGHDGAFMVAAGTVEIWRHADGEKLVLGSVRKGGLFGEMALINDEPRMASATAVEDTVCFAIPVEIFNHELDKTAPMIKSVLMAFIQHIRRLTGMLEEARRQDGLDEVQFFEADDAGDYKRTR